MDERIYADLTERYGLTCREVLPVAGGWLNQKWRVLTDAGDVLVKQFSNERYDAGDLAAVEAALQRQILLYRDGVPCPKIWLCGGRAIRLLDSETAYMVMEFCGGRVETPGTATAAQMLSLGDACGRMHKSFARLSARGVKGFPIDDGRVVESLWDNFHARVKAFTPEMPAAYRSAVLALEPILEQITASFLARLPKGISHEDFSADNMLFHADRLSAIVDFDRGQYGYRLHDVGRAILSLALFHKELDIAKISAFCSGYARHMALAPSDIADALRLCWCIETPWWIRPEFFAENHPKVIRFRDEMLWLTERWHGIDRMMGV